MAKKSKVNKTEAVRDYLKTHPAAKSGEIAMALNKKGIKITPGHVANIKTKLKGSAKKSVTSAVKKPMKAGTTAEVVNKSQAVKDYVKLHPNAVSSEIAKALGKQGVKITMNYVANIKTKINKGTMNKAAKKPEVAPVTTPAVIERPANGTITLAQIKRVAETIKSLGGPKRVAEVVETIRELGGVKKFKDLVDAMSPTSTDAIPF